MCSPCVSSQPPGTGSDTRFPSYASDAAESGHHAISSRFGPLLGSDYCRLVASKHRGYPWPTCCRGYCCRSGCSSNDDGRVQHVSPCQVTLGLLTDSPMFCPRLLDNRARLSSFIQYFRTSSILNAVSDVWIYFAGSVMRSARLCDAWARLSSYNGIFGRVVYWTRSVTSGVDFAGSVMRSTAMRLLIPGRGCTSPCGREIIGSLNPAYLWGCTRILTQAGRFLM